MRVVCKTDIEACALKQSIGQLFIAIFDFLMQLKAKDLASSLEIIKLAFHITIEHLGM